MKECSKCARTEAPKFINSPKIGYVCSFCYKKHYRETNKGKISEQRHEHYLNNKGKILEKNNEFKKTADSYSQYHSKYRELNSEKISEYKKSWYLQNKERIVEKSKARYLERRDEIIEKKRERRQRSKISNPEVETEDLPTLLNAFNNFPENK